MSGYKEFEGKTLDEAIRDACAYYDATRDKLEIDILNDSRGGIFGLVGAKKARVRARLVELSSVLDGLDSLADKGRQHKKRNEAPAGEPGRQGRREPREDSQRKERPPVDAPVLSAETAFAEAAFVEAAPAMAGQADAEPMAPQPDGERNSRGRSGKLARAPRRERPRNDGNRRAKPEHPKEPESVKQAPVEPESMEMDTDSEEFSRVPFDQLDITELENAAREIISRLTDPFLGTVTVTVAVSNDRVRISLSDVDDPGLLIGRDGQTLASLQYLVTRMLSNRMKALLRVQIDAGDYRERQDERLREMALSLAEKVKAGGRPQVTRPLSSYHRRVIHLTLQDDPQIQTHSKGEGEMKRVMVARRKGQA